MKQLLAGVGLGSMCLALLGGCPQPKQGKDAHPTTLKISIFNDSCSTYISPRLGVCPLGMANPPHYFVDPPPVITPGKSVTYSTDQVAGDSDGDCTAFSENFMVGIPGWGYGPTDNADTMTYVGMPDDPPYVGTIGTQFNCGDTIELHWSNCQAGGGAGTWTSNVTPGPGNPAPSEPFGPPPS